MKILILADGIPPEGKGGAERIAWDSACMLQEAGNEVIVITTTREKLSRTSESVREGIRVFSIPITYHMRWRAWMCLYNPHAVREVRRLVKEIQPDIVHAHNVHQYLSYSSLRAARATGARIVHTIHDVMPFNYGKLDTFIDRDNPVCKEKWNYKISAWKQFQEYRWRYNPIRNVCIRKFLREVDLLLAVSYVLREALAQNGIFGVEVLHNGISEEKWKFPEEALKDFLEKYALSSKKIILFGGRVSGAKGGDALLAVLPQIVTKHPKAVLLVTGAENDYVLKFKQSVQKNGMSEHVRYTGWITGTELIAANHAATVVVVPSVCFESLSNAALEGMVCAKPVVGSCFGGVAEVVRDELTGYLVHPLDTRALAHRISMLLLDDAKAHSFGMAGKLRQGEEFSESTQIQKLLTFYQKNIS